MQRISIIAALSRPGRVISVIRDNHKRHEMLWRIPEDLQRFKNLTTGHPCIMGRKTWEALPIHYRPLPNRPNIVVTRNENYPCYTGIKASSLDSAIALAGLFSGEEIFIIGGAEIYTQALNAGIVDRMYLTYVTQEYAYQAQKNADEVPHFKDYGQDAGAETESIQQLPNLETKTEIVFPHFEPEAWKDCEPPKSGESGIWRYEFHTLGKCLEG